MDSSATPTTESSWTPSGNGDGNGSGLMDKAREQLQPVVSQAQQKAGEVIGQATDQVKSKLAEQKDRATEGLDSVIQALRHTGQTLHIQHLDTAGQYVETAADQVEKIHGYLQEKNVDEIVDQVQDYARSQPALILGATFVLGFLAARLIKNAETGYRPQSDYPEGGYTDTSYSDLGTASGYSGTGLSDTALTGSDSSLTGSDAAPTGSDSSY